MKKLLLFLCTSILILGTSNMASALYWSDFVADYDDIAVGTTVHDYFNGGIDINGNGLVNFGDTQFTGSVNPDWGVGAPDTTYVSILPGESITYGFSTPFINVSGFYDIVIVETGHAGEAAYIEVSSNGTDFYSIGTVNVVNNGSANYTQYGTYYWFDLGLISQASYIKIISDSSLGATPGFDIAGVGAASPVPEPATMLLLGAGLVGLAGLRKKFKK